VIPHGNASDFRPPDAAALLDEDPASEKVQALANRWLALTIRARNGDSAVVQDSAKALLNGAQWPAALQARLAEFRLEEGYSVA